MAAAEADVVVAASNAQKSNIDALGKAYVLCSAVRCRRVRCWVVLAFSAMAE